MQGTLRAKPNLRLGFEMLETVIRKKSYGILSTISSDGRPHSAGVIYGVSWDKPLAFHLVTDGRSKKARNIGRNPSVSFVIPVQRRLWIIPPSSIQFQGRAEILPLTDETSREAFSLSIVLRRVLKAQLAQKKDVSVFIRVRPDPVVFTYGIGVSVTQLMRHIEGAAARVEIPQSYLSDEIIQQT